MGEARPRPDEGGERPRSRIRRGLLLLLGVFLVYEAIWLALVGPWILPDLSGRILARFGGETSVFVWSLRWWPHAVGNLMNPFVSTIVWAPTGINLAWATTAPGPSLIFAPVTLLGGPVVAFNAVMLLSPAANATAMFVLARHVTTNAAASLVAGLLFGFSPLVMREVSQGHLNLALLFLLPVAAYLVLRRFEGTLGRRAFVLLLTLTLVVQFSVFNEIYATMAVMGAATALIALVVGPRESRRPILELAGLVGLSYVLSAVLVSPYLYALAAYPDAMKPGVFEGIALGAQSAGDLLNFVVPGKGMLLGPKKGTSGVSNFWYFGIPLLVLLAAFWISRWRWWGVKLLAIGFLVGVVFSIGSEVPVGEGGIPMPWALFAHLPLIGRARPGRFVQYSWLFGSLSVGMWLAAVRWQGWKWRQAGGVALRVGLVVLAIVVILPKLGRDIWTREVPLVPFITSGAYRQYLHPGETVLVVGPFQGQQVYWQIETDLYFRLATWYQGFLPADYGDLSTALELRKGIVRVRDRGAILRYLRDHDVTAIIVGPGAQRGATRDLEAVLGVPAQSVGGVHLLRVAPPLGP
jgi:hypothetical protein